MEKHRNALKSFTWMDWTGLDPSGPPRAPCGANKQGPCQGAGKEGRG